jgi:hypothetical protein
MTDETPDDNVRDLSARFHLEQAEAESEQASRDQAQWDMAVAATKADTATKEGYAAHLEAKARFWRALAFAVNMAAIFGAATVADLMDWGWWG